MREIATTTGAFRNGGNDIRGELFQGFIDEIRIDNRALAPGEIQADMNTPIGNLECTARGSGFSREERTR